MTKRIKPTKKQIDLWNRLVDEVFNHPKSRYSLFVYELIKRRVLGTKNYQYKSTKRLDKQYKIKNIK